jgi:hypothetical protein
MLALTASDKGFSFQHKAYGPLRSQLNALIRFAHRVSGLQFIIFNFFYRSLPKDDNCQTMSQSCRELAADVDCSVQAELENILAEYQREIIRFLARTSPMFYVTVAYFVLRAIRSMLMQKVHNWKGALNSASAKYSSAVWAETALEEAMYEQRSSEVHRNGVIA